MRNGGGDRKKVQRQGRIEFNSLDDECHSQEERELDNKWQ
jgi:hypothetical protein